jgi:hypothetical protein
MFNAWRLIDAHMAYCPSGQKPIYRGSLHFEYLYSYVQGHASASKLVSSATKTRTTALWLTSYLAHWGMFRGSGRLRDTNLLFFEHLVKKLLDGRHGILRPFFDVPFTGLRNAETQALDHALDGMSAILRENGISATDTLRSKIILGLTHSVPGYDRFFNIGIARLREDGVYLGPVKFGAEGLIALSAWYAKQTWPRVASSVDPALRLPAARLVDMALNQYGRELDAETRRA